MPQDAPYEKLFGFDEPGDHSLGELGWCEAAFQPPFEVKVLEGRGDHELVQDAAGRRAVRYLAPWPEGRRWAAAITHDLDIVSGWPLFTTLREHRLIQ